MKNEVKKYESNCEEPGYIKGSGQDPARAIGL